MSIMATTYTRVSAGVMRSHTMLTFLSLIIGTTISLADSLSQAMWPGKLSTSGTSCVDRVDAAVPQTPRPKAIVWHATCSLSEDCFSERVRAYFSLERSKDELILLAGIDNIEASPVYAIAWTRQGLQRVP